jgi:GT2 family glycosyltransferase
MGVFSATYYRVKKVSIIISNYNGGVFLKKCLDSLMKLDYPDYEIIVVDAGSTDGSTQTIKKCFPKVKLIERGRIGIGEAINIGIRMAKGEVIIFDFNSDEIATPDWLSRLVEILDSTPEIGVVGGTRIYYGTDFVDCAGAKISLFGYGIKIGRGKGLTDLPKYPQEVDYVPCIATRREVIERVGMLDEAFYIYGEDSDFCLRVRKAGYRVLHVPCAVTYHLESASIGKETPKYVYFSQRALIRLVLKHFSVPRMLITLFWVGFMVLVNMAILFPPFRKIVLHTPYQHWASRNTLAHFKALLAALWWNLKNIRLTFAARKRLIISEK